MVLSTPLPAQPSFTGVGPSFPSSVSLQCHLVTFEVKFKFLAGTFLSLHYLTLTSVLPFPVLHMRKWSQKLLVSDSQEKYVSLCFCMVPYILLLF